MNRKSAVISLLFVALVGAAVGRPGWAAADTGPPETRARPVGSDYVPGELLVRFDTHVPAPARERPAGGRHRGRTGRPSFDRVAPWLQRVVLDEGVDVEDAAAELLARGDVVYAEPNYRIHAAGIPNDTRFPEQYGLHNTGQSIRHCRHGRRRHRRPGGVERHHRQLERGRRDGQRRGLRPPRTSP